MLIALEFVEDMDCELQIVYKKLTKQQVKNSLGARMNRLVADQQAIGYHGYYGSDLYWRSGLRAPDPAAAPAHGGPPTCGKANLRLLAILGSAAVLLLAGILAYAALTTLIEERVAANLKERYGLVQEPVVEVSSDFPPELLLGRADRIEVYIDSFTKEGIGLRNLHVDIEAVDVSAPRLLQGDLEREIRSGSLTAEVPEESINQYLRENELGLQGGEIDVQPGNVFYKRANGLFGLPASINLDLRVASTGTIEVTPEGAVVGGFPLPPFLTEPLASGGRTLTVGDLPLGAELVSVEPQDDVLMIRAER